LQIAVRVFDCIFAVGHPEVAGIAPGFKVIEGIHESGIIICYCSHKIINYIVFLKGYGVRQKWVA
jgi:hypothetical protein